MEYLDNMNALQLQEIKALNTIKKRQQTQISQLETDLSTLTQEMIDEQKRKRGWRTAAIISSGLFIVTLIATL